MGIEKPKIEEGKKEPIVDIEINKAILEAWEKRGLNNTIHGLIDGDFERIVPSGERFVLCPDNFKPTASFIDATEKSFSKFEGKNLEEKMKEVENEARKVVLNFTFKELEFDPKNPEIVKQEKIKQNDKELTIQYFKTNQENLLLAFDSTDWWLERK